ncbi:glycosyltransferase [Salinirubrum litoreum]|uniref:Glycosyltransferase n=1 Tax=Salinirubrum litoreum TaxID=1126234 RepID=A0ABD5RB50_9EURY|nr:glycosyltransferase family 2 protein [Salinirubrum litoreum]
MSSRVESWPEHSFFPERLYTAAWALSLVVTLVGTVGVGLGPETRPTGYALLATGGGALALFSLSAEIRRTVGREASSGLRLAIVGVGGLAFVSGVAFAAGVLPGTAAAPLTVRLLILATAFQALLVSVDIRPARPTLRARVAVLLMSHGAIFAGSVLTFPGGPTVPRAGLLLYAGGFGVLLLNAFWARTLSSGTVPPEPETDRRRWEGVLLGAIVVGVLGATAMVLTTQTGTLGLRTPLTQLFATVTGAAAAVALATLGVPQSAPLALGWLDSPAVTVSQHVSTLFVVVNGFVLGIFVAAPGLLGPVFRVFLAALLVGVVLNYAMLLYARRRDPDADPTDPTTALADAGVTVVVTGANEVDALSASLRENVAALDPLPFLLVPAARSSDGTQEVMQAVREDHPDRIRVVEGTGGSKAGDLNQVWEHVETPYVLLLDADETVGASFVTRALRVLSARPDVGIVQGRKYATYPDASRLSRFVSAERQHSTWLDHPFDADVLAAAHFAGSAAVLQREVLPDVDGFASDLLTEDIDLTIRLYLQTDWDVVYVPEMGARELLPGSWTSLLRQRERWARGWAQVAGRHLGDVVRSWRALGLRRTAGLSWLLLLAVSAPLYVIFPALVVPTVALDASLQLSLPVAAAFAVFLLPERAISFAYAVFRDPDIPASTSLRRIVETVAAAYLWIAFGWLVQLHSLYLQFAGAPQTWTVTRKSRPPVASPPDDD